MAKAGRPKKTKIVISTDTTDYKKSYLQLVELYKEAEKIIGKQKHECELNVKYTLSLESQLKSINYELNKSNSTLSQCFTREFLYKEFINTLLEKLKGSSNEKQI